VSITDFVLARIAEDEAVASVATRGPWFVDQVGDFGDKGAVLEIARWRGHLNTVNFDEDFLTADHIARHDPARVLAQCAAMRKIVERHTQRGGVASWMDAVWVADMDDAERAGFCAWCTYDDRTVRFPCGDLQDLASIWSDHPDWREEWA
jgi:hypothetical protein